MFCHLFRKSLMLLALAVGARASDDIYYYVYYATSDCGEGTQPVTVAGAIADNKTFTIQGSSSRSSCSEDGYCLLLRTSDQCKANEPTVLAAINATFLDGGNAVQECDASNNLIGLEDCSVLTSDACEQSSFFPLCHFRVFTESELFSHPSAILQNSQEAPAWSKEHYVIYFSDSECTQIEGLRGRLEGKTTQLVVDDTHSCKDAMFCLFNDESEACQSYGSNKTLTFTLTNNDNDATVVDICNDDTGECLDVSSFECQKSAAYASCYYRLVSARDFFGNPGNFLIATDDATSVAAADSVAVLTPLLAVLVSVTSNFPYF